jgi:hypothetical protein
MNINKNLIFRNIDLLRGFAAITVLIYHVIEHLSWTNFPISGFLSWFRMGWVAVDMFFVISGFVIGLTVFNNINSKNWRYSFCLKRFYRIIPLHYLTILIWIIFIQPGFLFEKPLSNIGSHLLFIHNLSFYHIGSINGVNWSLATEMQFYLLMCIFGKFIFNARFYTFSILFIVLAWVWRYLAIIYPYYPADLPLTYTHFSFVTQLVGMLDEFAFGLILAKLILSKFWTRLIAANSFYKILLLFIAIVFLSISIQIYWHFSNFWDNAYMVIFFRTLFTFSFSLIVFFACLISFKGLILKLLSPFFYLGTISYGIYLWHLPIIESLKKIQWLTPLQFMFMTIILTLILSSISYHFFEKPIMERLKK